MTWIRKVKFGLCVISFEILKYVMRSIFNKNLNTNFFFSEFGFSLGISWWGSDSWSGVCSSGDAEYTPLISVWHVSFPDSSVVVVWINHIHASLFGGGVGELLSGQSFSFFDGGTGGNNILIISPWIGDWWCWWSWWKWETEHIENFIIVSWVISITLWPDLFPVGLLILHNGRWWDALLLELDCAYCSNNAGNCWFHFDFNLKYIQKN